MRNDVIVVINVAEYFMCSTAAAVLVLVVRRLQQRQRRHPQLQPTARFDTKTFLFYDFILSIADWQILI